tara:strand:+ start:1149 stop:1334 length:186 start_codon:yes stop_codon:yes gene_type:complete
MIDMLIDIGIGLLLCCIGGILYHILYTWYKDREWARNNPDEYRMEYPIEDKPKAPKKMMME